MNEIIFVFLRSHNSSSMKAAYSPRIKIRWYVYSQGTCISLSPKKR